jgi:predicted nucleotidyltransferase
MHGREIARELKATAPPVNMALKQLESEGILLRRIHGRVHIYSMNTSPWVTEFLLKPLFQEEEKLSDRLLKAIDNHIRESNLKEEILSVAVFGSIYTQQEKPNSDIDLLVIIKDGRNKGKIEDLIFDCDKVLFPKVRLALEPHVYSQAEFQSKYNSPKKIPFIKEVMKNHKICYGQKLEVLL